MTTPTPPQVVDHHAAIVAERTVAGQSQPFTVTCLRPLDEVACEFFSGPRVRKNTCPVSQSVSFALK